MSDDAEAVMAIIMWVTCHRSVKARGDLLPFRWICFCSVRTELAHSWVSTHVCMAVNVGLHSNGASRALLSRNQ